MKAIQISKNGGPEVLELKANPNRNAEGTVIESKIEKGKGTVDHFKEIVIKYE